MFHPAVRILVLRGGIQAKAFAAKNTKLLALISKELI